MADEIHDIPHALGLSGVTTPYVNPVGMPYDYDIGGIFFLSAASDELPYQRALADIRKEQIDTSPNPGDNSLEGWWVRSQTDWSLGAGQEVMEPIDTEGVDRRYLSSAGVDTMSSPGHLSLLPKPSSASLGTASTEAKIVAIPNGYIVASGTTVTRVVSGVSTSATAAGNVTGLCIAGPNVLVASSGRIEWAPVSGAFTLTTGFTCTGIPRMWWVKSRILIAVGPELHENPGSVITGSTNLDAATPLYDMKDSTAQIVSAASTPTSILLAVAATSGSTIQALTLDTDGTLPSTTAPVIVAEFPVSETLYDVATYLGTYVGISTSRGIRIGTLSQSGGLAYGPLLGSPVAATQDHVFTSYDRFLHYPVADAGDGRGGLVRIDLSEIDRDGRAAWSTFIRAATAEPVNDAVVTGPRSAYLVSRSGSTNKLWTADGTSQLDTGWLESSIIRYGTLETKQFMSIKVVTDVPLVGSVSVSTAPEGGSAASVGSMSSATGPSVTFNAGLRSSSEGMSVRLDLAPDAGAPTTGPSVAAWSVRALPAVENRGERVVLPLLNFDFERDTLGVPYGYEGRAYQRWMAVASRLTDGTQVVIQEGQSGASYVATVDDLVFQQVAPPVRASGFGGVIQLKVRAIS